VRGRRNEPAHVCHTLAALADLRGIAPDVLGSAVDANADAAFGLTVRAGVAASGAP
jgi:Tat protein secretion system quality control protein TatD with DNase activity